MTSLELASQWTEMFEGKRNRVYRDSLGIATIGIGRNLEDVGLNEQEIYFLFNNDMAQAARDAVTFVGSSVFESLNTVRQAVLIDMAFNLGLPRLQNFRKFREAIVEGDFMLAGAEMEDSRWFRQVKGRARYLKEKMELGE